MAIIWNTSVVYEHPNVAWYHG